MITLGIDEGGLLLLIPDSEGEQHVYRLLIGSLEPFACTLAREGSEPYRVVEEQGSFYCGCPAFYYRWRWNKDHCKHSQAVEQLAQVLAQIFTRAKEHLMRQANSGVGNGGEGNEGSIYLTPPARVVRAVCVAVVDLGTQDREYKGEAKETPMVALVWELHWTEAGTPKNVLVAREYANYVSERAKLRAVAVACLPDRELEDSFVASELAGCACQVQITHKKKGQRTYWDLGQAHQPGFLALGDGMTAPEPIRTPVVIELDQQIPAWIPRMFGKSLAGVRSQCQELRGQTQAPQREQGEQGDAYEGDLTPPPDDADCDWIDRQVAVIDAVQASYLTKLFKSKGGITLEAWLEKAGFDDVSQVTLASYDKVVAYLLRFPNKSAAS